MPMRQRLLAFFGLSALFLAVTSADSPAQRPGPPSRPSGSGSAPRPTRSSLPGGGARVPTRAAKLATSAKKLTLQSLKSSLEWQASRLVVKGKVTAVSEPAPGAAPSRSGGSLTLTVDTVLKGSGLAGGQSLTLSLPGAPPGKGKETAAWRADKGDALVVFLKQKADGGYALVAGSGMKKASDYSWAKP
jgi:hypothetical protein